MRSSDDGDSIASGSDLIDSDHSRSGSLNASNGPVKSPSAAGERSGDEYDEEEFEDYSDSFEDDEDEEPSIPKDGKSSAHQSDGAERVHAWEVGERVQVFWEDDNVWFDGVVRRTRGQEVYIDYDDGESAWEATSLLRVSPELYDWAPQQYDQLQVKQSEDQKCDLTDRAVAVYWPEENEWFKGAVRTANSMHGLLVCYEDGDSRWEHVRQWPQWISATAEKYADVDELTDREMNAISFFSLTLLKASHAPLKRVKNQVDECSYHGHTSPVAPITSNLYERLAFTRAWYSTTRAQC